MKLSRPTGFFQTLLAITVAPSFLVIGILALILGGALLCQTSFVWAPSLGHFLLSMGFAFFFFRYLNLSLTDEQQVRSVNVALAIAFGVFFIGHQQDRNAIRGIVLMGDKTVETTQVYRGGATVSQHLGAPLNLSEGNESTPQSIQFGWESEDGATVRSNTARTQLSGWSIEQLGRQYQDSGLQAVLRLELEGGKQTEFAIGIGKTHLVNEQLTVRLAAIDAMGPGDGHRLLVELIGEEGIQRKMLYDAIPNLEAEIAATMPRVAVMSVSHEPAHAFYIYENRPKPHGYAALAVALFALIAAVWGRERAR